MTIIAEVVEPNIIKINTKERKEPSLIGFDMCYIRIDGTPNSQKRHRTTMAGGKMRNYDPSSKDKEKFRKKYKLNSDDNKIMKVLRKLEDLLGFDSYETIRNIKEK